MSNLSALRRQAETLQAGLDVANGEKHSAVARAEAAASRLGKVEQQLISLVDERDRLREERLTEAHTYAVDKQAAKEIDQSLREELAAEKKLHSSSEETSKGLRSSFDSCVHEVRVLKENARDSESMTRAAEERKRALEADLRVVQARFDNEVSMEASSSHFTADHAQQSSSAHRCRIVTHGR